MSQTLAILGAVQKSAQRIPLAMLSFTLPFVITLAAVLYAPSLANAAGLRATVDRSRVSLGEQVVLTVTLEGSKATEPMLPDLPDFKIYSRGTSRQMQIVNGRTTSSLAMTYILLAQKTGRFNFGQVKAQIDGVIYHSKAFFIEVVPAGQVPAGQNPDIFLRTSVSNKNPYVGEQIIYILRFYRRLRITDAQADLPEFKAFQTHELGEAKEYKTVVAGKEYQVWELRRALFAENPGPQELKAASIKAEVVVGGRSSFGFFGRNQPRRQVIRCAAIKLDINALPCAPADFSGLVGIFQITTSVNKRQLKVGESATLSVRMSGTGNAFRLGEPDLPAIDSVKVYRDKPSTTLDPSSKGLRGSKSFRISLVPSKPGSLIIPSLKLKYFDPKQGGFRLSQTQSITLSVAQGDGKEELGLTQLMGSGGGRVAVKVLGDDILPIHTSLEALEDHGVDSRFVLLSSTGVALPGLLYALLAFLARRRRKEKGDNSLRRRRKALRTAMADIKGIEGTSIDAAVLASRIFRSFVGDILNREGRALTPQEVGSSLRAHGAGDTLAGKAAAFLRACEESQYGHGAIDATQLSSLEGIIKELNQVIR